MTARMSLETRIQPIARHLTDSLADHADMLGVETVYYGDQESCRLHLACAWSPATSPAR